MSQNVKIALFIVISVLLVTFTFYGWQITQTPNFQQDKDKDFALLIPEGATYDTVLDSLKKHEVLNDHISFRFMAKLLNYPERVQPGRYILKKNMGNWAALQKLRHGQQDPVRLTFNNVRLKEDLIERIGTRFAFGPQKLGELLRNDSVCQKYGFDTTTIVSMFLPNT
ncbi:MAG: aminodeoxychorismate lyase, partial [Runella slithyformis]